MNQKIMEVPQDNHFINVQANILRINHFLVDGKRIPFTPELKLYYGYFYTWAIQVDKVCPSKEYIAEQMGESKPTAMKRIKALVELGLLRIEIEGRKHIYHLTMPNEVIKMAHGTITAKADSKKPKVVKTVAPQEPQQPAIKPALPSSNDLHTPADSSSDDSQHEQQTASPPVQETKTKTGNLFPWGSSGAFKSNGDVIEEAKQWALSQTCGDVPKAEVLVSGIINEKNGGNLKYTFKKEDPVYDAFDVPF
ncbi:helix-turn-helix domain-containing protein [Pantoea sp.]|uniref:helix-turn-helix domain-containing protein n=1 Tax=Pantoea sp. TaxID=69393 RepID=UPI002911759A|nr:helix-turn-helix domain-containing protein [Pantoea sp.]MDU4127985.1 helix-turn-helix domain-containing protein [Pantoea sp.]